MNQTEKITWLKNYYKDHGYPIQKFNLIGVRNTADIKKDIINDRLGFFTDSELFLRPGTTDPSVYWTLSKERNQAGTFHLRSGFQSRLWAFGIHRGYEAFVNDYRRCRPTEGWRDADYNFVQGDKDKIVRDYIGINFHRMHNTILVKVIGKYSAGCQVVRDIKDFNYILQQAKQSGVIIFNYMLFMIDEVPAEFLE